MSTRCRRQANRLLLYLANSVANSTSGVYTPDIEAYATTIEKQTFDAVRPDKRQDPKVRKQLSGPALRAFFQIADAWNLTVGEQIALLGYPGESTYFKYKAAANQSGRDTADGIGTLSFDTLVRISLVLGIFKALHILYADELLARRWVKLPNSQSPVWREAGAGPDGQRHRWAVSSSATARRQARMSPVAPANPVSFKDTFRLIPSRYPSTGILDRIAAPEDLDAIIELESWTNDRISTELGLLHHLPKEEWVVGKRMSSVIMAAFCQPRITGARFSRARPRCLVRGAHGGNRACRSDLPPHPRTRGDRGIGNLCASSRLPGRFCGRLPRHPRVPQ